jgi:hypothetical protein
MEGIIVGGIQMSGKITADTKRHASVGLSDHDLPATSCREEAATSSPSTRDETTNVVRQLERRGHKLPLVYLVRTLVQEEKPFSSYR